VGEAEVRHGFIVRSLLAEHVDGTQVIDFNLSWKRGGFPQPSIVPTMERLARNISASQYKTWVSCHRSWWFDKVAKVRKRQMQAHVIGHATHSVIERYILGQAGSWEGLFPAGWNKGLDATESDWLQRMVRAGIEKGVIQSTPGSLVELPVAMLTAAHHVDARGLPLLCKAETYLDEQLVRRIAKFTTLYDGSPLPADWDRIPPFVGFIDHLLLDADPPLVADHKTAKNRRYATTVKKLAEDTQVIAYSAVPMILRPDVSSVMCRHNVYIKEEGGPDPYCVQVPITIEKTLKVWSEIRMAVIEMEQVRIAAPIINDPTNPFNRANNWQKVTSAIEAGCAQESCSAYGGCPYKDICYGRSSAEQVVKRLDSPDPLTLVQKPLPPSPPPKKFGLNLGNHMPFAAPKPQFAINQDVYVIDPDDATTQYRARITAIADQIALAIYPDPDVLPMFTTLAATYRITLPKEAVMPLPLPSVRIGSYYVSLKAAGTISEADMAWTPAVVPPSASAIPLTPALAPIGDVQKAMKRPERDGKFGFGGLPGTTAAGVVNPDAFKNHQPTGPGLQSGSTTPAAPPAAILPPNPPTTPGTATLTPPKVNAPLTGPTEAWAKVVRPGALVEVIPSEHSFWAQHSGKTALLRDATMGDNNTIMLTVEIEGAPYPEVDSRRFRLKAIEHQAVVAEPDPYVAALDQYRALIGKAVTVCFQSTLSSLNAELQAVDEEGITLIGKKYPWSDITAFNAMTPTDVPGSKEALKAAKAAIKASAAAATTAAIDPGTALDKAIDMIQVALNGGKVTKKVLEGALPYLQAAKAARGGSPILSGIDQYRQALTDVTAAIEALSAR
jgi:PD-(D/E)XK nuclease superfamily